MCFHNDFDIGYFYDIIDKICTHYFKIRSKFISFVCDTLFFLVYFLHENKIFYILIIRM